nr:serine hydrolase domain-containing protein [Vallicoccus soli]
MPGDAALAARLDELVAGRPAVAATVAAGRTATASRGVPLEADVELGSVSKGLTGLLYADAVDRGEVAPGTRLGDLLTDLDGSPAGDAVLAALATHRSGLPRLPAGSRALRRTVALWRTGANPYGEDLPALLAQARRTRVGRPRPRYSNLGYELLGHALAAAAGTTYADLLHDRLTGPLGMGGTYVPASPAQLRPGAATGADRRGRPRAPWTGEGLGPAGGVRSTAADLGRLLAALLDGGAPGLRALDPVERLGPGARIGAAWVVVRLPGRVLTWHNGGTGGFRSWVGLDRDAGCGAAVVAADGRGVDRQGQALLEGLGAA